MSFLSATESKLSTSSISNVVNPNSDIGAVCQTSSQKSRRAAAKQPSIQSIDDLSSGWAIQKRRKQRLTDVPDYAEQFERAMAITEERKDEFQVFGNYIASLMRNITNIVDARRTQRKITLFTLNCIEELEVEPSSSKVEVSRPSMSTCSWGTEMAVDMPQLYVHPEIYVSPNYYKKKPSTPELYVPPKCEYEPQPSMISAPQTEEDISLDIAQHSATELQLITRNGKLIHVFKIIRDSKNSNARLVGENGEYIDETTSQQLLHSLNL